MAGDKNDVNILESLVDIMNELLSNKEEPPVVNPPIPSLNNISKKENKSLTITKKDADKLLHILKGLGEELKEKEKIIESLKLEKEDRDKLLTKLKKLEKREKSYVEEDVNNNQNTIESKELVVNCTFKDELKKHVSDIDLVTIIVVAGKDCCKFSGYPCRICNDFIVLVNNDTELIKIPINKIAAIKVDNNGGKKRRYNHDGLEDDEESNYHSSVLPESDIDSIASKEEEQEDDIAVAEQGKDNYKQEEINSEKLDEKDEMEIKKDLERRLIESMKFKVL